MENTKEFCHKAEQHKGLTQPLDRQEDNQNSSRGRNFVNKERVYKQESFTNKKINQEVPRSYTLPPPCNTFNALKLLFETLIFTPRLKP